MKSRLYNGIRTGSLGASKVKCLTGMFLCSLISATPVSQVIAAPVEGMANVEQQVNTITGTVNDEAHMPVIGANVLVKGKTVGTITDLNGNFSLQAEIGEILEISFIGYKTITVKVTDKNPIDIVLKEDLNQLEDVVVVGYGVQKKKLVTGATVQVKGDDIAKMNTVSPLSALQSQTPGVNITKVSGQPGSGFKVAIRGVGTTGDSQPLYIIDGLPGNIDYLNPADIASIDVLKDAASAAIYGSRAANGVVLVTTKKGSVGKASIEYNGYYGIQKFINNVHPLNAQQYAMIQAEGYENCGKPVPDFASLVPDWDRIQSGEWNGTNWLKEGINDHALMKNHSLSVRGGTEQSIYSLSFNYTDQEGIFGAPASPEYKRYSVMVNTEHTLYKKGNLKVLKVGENLRYKYDTSSGVNAQGSTNNRLRIALSASPFLPVFDENGNYHKDIPWDNKDVNPSGLLYYEDKDNERHNHQLSGDAYLELQPIKDLKFRSSFGYKFSNNSSRKYIPVYDLGFEKFTVEDMVNQSLSNAWSYQVETTANYKWKMGRHNFDALAGFTVSKSGMGTSINGTNYNSNFTDFDHAYLDNTPNIISGRTMLSGGPVNQGRGVSAFGRVNYDFKETYMFTAVFRADGSSKFARGHRWGYFPSFSAGWVMTNEKFMEKVTNWMDFFKLRVSWGRNGNSSIAPFQYLSNIALDSKYFFGDRKDNPAIGAYPLNVPNQDISWETSEQIDLGFDSRFFDSRLNVVFDYYTKTTKDWLVVAPIVGIYGAKAPAINGGDVRNRGAEIGLSWRDSFKDFKYGVNFNLGYNKNEITKIDNSEGIIHGTKAIPWNNVTEIYRAQVGYPIGYFYGFETNGLFQNEQQIQNYTDKNGNMIMPNAKPGDIIFIDRNGDGIIDARDKTKIGDPNPDFTFGMSFNLGYKGFDLSGTANGVAGNEIFRAYRHPTKPNHNYTTEDLGRWHGEGTSNSIPRITVNGHMNDVYPSQRYIESGSYLRISNITLGYDFKYLFPKLPLQQARLYVTGQNLATITKYKGFDPEVGFNGGIDKWATGIDVGSYPSPRVFMVGFSLKY